LVSLLIIIPFCIWGEKIDQWSETLIEQGRHHPFQTGGILALLLASDIVLPVPSCFASAACGLVLGFAYGTAASFIGMTLCCLGGYALGRLCTPAAKKMLGANESERLKEFEKKYGIWLILALRPVPILAEASILFSGITRQPFMKTILIASIGNLAVSAIYAGVGALGETKQSTITAFIVSALLSAVMMLLTRKKNSAVNKVYEKEGGV